MRISSGSLSGPRRYPTLPLRLEEGAVHGPEEGGPENDAASSPHGQRGRQPIAAAPPCPDTTPAPRSDATYRRPIPDGESTEPARCTRSCHQHRSCVARHADEPVCHPNLPVGCVRRHRGCLHRFHGRRPWTPRPPLQLRPRAERPSSIPQTCPPRMGPKDLCRTVSRTHAHQQLVAEILARYGSLDAFLLRLRLALDDPTIELPPTAPPPDTTRVGRHARTDH